MRKGADNGNDSLVRVLQDLLIVQLAVAGVPKQNIRRIVGCAMGRVTRITRHLNVDRKRRRAEE